ncbi:MAG: phosphatidylglycerophosphatase A [Verrucomicrobiaceae bacterium]|nr:phosphatidylglycerophosphatase A [Verrucomicrobiaceae bacterium]
MPIKEKLYPWADKLSKNVAVKTATLFGIGNLAAPGTWGSAVGIALYPLFCKLNVPLYILACIVLAYIAVGICDAAERHLQVRDPGMINLDEFVAMPVCFFNPFETQYSIWGLLLGFALFRLFDITKLLFINKLQALEGGLGCVADDIAAGIVTCICLISISFFTNFLII